MTPTLVRHELKPEEGLLIVSCSKEKLVTDEPVPALELYQGALVPYLRDHLDEVYHSRIRILSARYGLLRPDDRIHPYDQKLRSRPEALALQSLVTHRLTADLRAPTLRRILVALDPLYLTAAICLFDHAPPLNLSVLSTTGDWSSASTKLTQWGWL